MRRCLILSFSPIASDPRVLRQIDALAGTFELTVCGFGAFERPGVRFVPVRPARRSARQRALGALWLKTGQFERFYWSTPMVCEALFALQKTRFDITFANDVNTLPLALRLAGQAPVLLDAHEYAPLEFSDNPIWSFFYRRYQEYLCQTYLRRVRKLVTVCQGVGEMYERTFGVSAEVVPNLAREHSVPVRPTDPSAIRMIHHGAAVASRRIEGMIEVVAHLDGRFSLDLVLVPGDARYIEKLRRGTRDARVRFLPAVPMEQLVLFSSQYDIGLFLLPPTNFNYHMALPNKFFEFIQARLAVAVGPSPEMARILRQYENGIVAEDFEPLTLARRLNAVDAAMIDRMKHASDRAARELNAGSAVRAYARLAQGLVD